MPTAAVPELVALPGPHLTRDALAGVDLVTHLVHAAAAHPQPLVVHADGSFFAPHMGTVGCVGVRGTPAVREVLSNGADLGPLLPDLGDLPDDVRSLSRGVFSFDGPLHLRHRSELRRLIALDERTTAVLRDAAAEALRPWAGRNIDLTGACRDVAGDVWSAVLFGPGERGRALGRGVRAVVDGRRERRMATTGGARRAAGRRTVVASRALASALHDWLAAGDRDGLLAGLGDGLAPGDPTTLAVAHATALCAAGTEPAAASLAWAVLCLTQRPDLQARIRDGDHDLLDRALRESQRLLPSSAIVTRATLRPVEVVGHRLPARCELMVSSFLAHRDPDRFPDPLRFEPDRWLDTEPGPFEFFPFGAGGRGCLGATVARAMLRTTLAELLAGSTVTLPFDRRVGWQMPDALVPAAGVPVTVAGARRPAGAGGDHGRAVGPITTLVEFGPRQERPEVCPIGH